MTIDRVGGGVLALLALFAIEETYRLKLPLGNLQNPGPAYMPIVLGLLLAIFALLVVAFGARTERFASIGWSEWRHAVAILVVCAFMAYGLERLGYRVTVAVGLAVLLGVLERRSIVTTAAFAIGFAAGTFFLFETLLRVPLPRGLWGL
jgi:hypothetical protein